MSKVAKLIIGVLKENQTIETRIPLIPASVQNLTEAGATVWIEEDLGDSLKISNAEYVNAGGEIKSKDHILSQADMVLRLRNSEISEIAKLKKGAIHISYYDPYNEHEHTDAFNQANVTAISMQMIPRTTRAQKMDALSSQASLAGYAMVILAAERLNKILPMMVTPAGTIRPARVFVIGAGVAGLQAIATAKRLGARVDAFDTRPVVKEQVESLGGKFVDIDLGDTGQTSGGYAKQLTQEQLELQRQGQTKIMAQSDIVITTAQLFARPAPRIITKEMINGMQAGSVIVDLAVDSGGNVEGSRPDEVVTHAGVEIIGFRNMPARVAQNASQMYSANLHNLILEYWDKETKLFNLEFNDKQLQDEILHGCVITHNGVIINPAIHDLKR